MGPRKIREALNREASGAYPAAVLTGSVVLAISTIQQALARRAVLTHASVDQPAAVGGNGSTDPP